MQEFILDKIGLLAGITIGGVSLLTIVGFVLWKVLSASFNRALRKINLEKIVDIATDKAVDRIKKVSFNHNIQPIVLSEVKKLGEEIKLDVRKEFAEIKENQRKQVVIAEKQASYFEDSIVSDDKKKALKDAIEDAKQDSVVVESVVVEETTEPTEKANTTPLEAVKTQTKLER